MTQYDPRTSVMLVFIRDRIEQWLRFGHDFGEQILDRRRRLIWFAPGTVFGFIRWQANDYGTLVSRINILRACTPAEPCSTVPGVGPGGEILLRQSGWSRVQRVLAVIDTIESAGFDPADIAPHYWRHVHNRLTCSAAPR